MGDELELAKQRLAHINESEAKAVESAAQEKQKSTASSFTKFSEDLSQDPLLQYVKGLNSNSEDLGKYTMNAGTEALKSLGTPEGPNITSSLFPNKFTATGNEPGKFKRGGFLDPTVRGLAGGILDSFVASGLGNYMNTGAGLIKAENIANSAAPKIDAEALKAQNKMVDAALKNSPEGVMQARIDLGNAASDIATEEFKKRGIKDSSLLEQLKDIAFNPSTARDSLENQQLRKEYLPVFHSLEDKNIPFQTAKEVLGERFNLLNDSPEKLALKLDSVTGPVGPLKNVNNKLLDRVMDAGTLMDVKKSANPVIDQLLSSKFPQDVEYGNIIKSKIPETNLLNAKDAEYFIGQVGEIGNKFKKTDPALARSLFQIKDNMQTDLLGAIKEAAGETAANTYKENNKSLQVLIEAKKAAKTMMKNFEKIGTTESGGSAMINALKEPELLKAVPERIKDSGLLDSISNYSKTNVPLRQAAGVNLESNYMKSIGRTPQGTPVQPKNQ